MSRRSSRYRPAGQERPFLTGLLRGLGRRCPHCGRGALFAGYLKVAPICGHCGENNGQYPADDVAPYVTILLVGHLIVLPVLVFHLVDALSVAAGLAVLLPSITGLTLVLLPYVKGGVVGVSWALRVTRQKLDAPR